MIRSTDDSHIASSNGRFEVLEVRVDRHAEVVGCAVVVDEEAVRVAGEVEQDSLSRRRKIRAQEVVGDLDEAARVRAPLVDAAGQGVLRGSSRP